MPHITIYTGSYCPYCIMAKQFLQQLGAQEFEEIRVDQNIEQFVHMQQITGQRTVPQIFIGERHIGGFTDMYALHQQGDLLPLLAAN